MKSFTPRLDILSASQRQLWPELAAMPKIFVLYGGTALAVQLGHRSSVDFDFFSSQPFEAQELMRQLPFLSGGQLVQRETNTLTCMVQRSGPIKISFFGGLHLGRVGESAEAEDNKLLVASLLDLAGTKAAVVQLRAESRDYLDILALLQHGISLPAALGAGQALYREQFNPMLTLKALSYYEDGDLHRLSEEQRRILTEAVAQAREIPSLPRIGDSISPVES